MAYMNNIGPLSQPQDDHEESVFSNGIAVPIIPVIICNL